LDLNGEYEVSVDSKNRFLFPAGLRKQFADNEQKVFWVNRGVTDCLRLYSQSEWDRLNSYVRKLNPLSTPVQNFKRMFRAGATKIELDAAGRMNVDKKLLEYAGISTQAVLYAQGDYVEIWNPAALEKYFNDNRDKVEEMTDAMSTGKYMNPFD
jgi:MraZ protein